MPKMILHTYNQCRTRKIFNENSQEVESMQYKTQRDLLVFHLPTHIRYIAKLL